MKKVLVASHGHLASGIRSSIEILTGMADMVEAVDCYVDDSDFTPRIQAFIDSVGPEDEAIIFTDIYGGSVFQKVVLMEPEKRGIVHVTGMNLGLVIEALLGAEAVTADSIKQSVELARATMQVVEPPSKAADNEGSDGDFFD
ncbi:PTS sugar transporter subunit IIA [Collinsella sp. TM06-3]|uniref:PTS sugar transporter subunit IIA n=1 Tax=Collinsella sp. TM06-3 TaxID=2292342 RepID=UPI000E4350AA|nr:PTS sugar transporter subunit IIA [Collinsella sp. TM06-3]RGJ50273.1 PTS fructose transporter subunit IIA [Collinsella sp. TM06-3]